MNLRNIAVAAAIGASLMLNSGCQTETAPVKKVASIDESAVYEMEMFTKARKEVDEWGKTKSEEMAKEVEKASDEDKAKKFQEFQAALEIKTNETFNPLKEKVRAAVARAANDKNFTVVLDKKIIVFGVDDMTEDVKQLLESGAEITYPDDKQEEIEKAPIGYFDQNIIRQLKVFREAEAEVVQERERLLQSVREELKKAEKAGKKPSPAEMQAMQQSIEARLESLKQQKSAPLLKAVSDAVDQVAKEEDLSLVLDTQHVMYGGRNLTELVVDTFLKNVSKGKAEAETASPESKSMAPEPAATPPSEG